jgi:hypothetical protein
LGLDFEKLVDVLEGGYGGRATIRSILAEYFRDK